MSEENDEGIPTILVDLNDIPIENLPACKGETYESSLKTVMRQVGRHRENLNESGPPGRAD